MPVCRFKIRCDRIRFAVQDPFQNVGNTHKDGLRRSFTLGPFCLIHVSIIGIAAFKVGFPKHAETDKRAQSQKAEHLTQAGGVGAISFFCQNLAIAWIILRYFSEDGHLSYLAEKSEPSIHHLIMAPSRPRYSIIPATIFIVPVKCRVCHNLAVEFHIRLHRIDAFPAEMIQKFDL